MLNLSYRISQRPWEDIAQESNLLSDAVLGRSIAKLVLDPANDELAYY